MKKLFIFLVLTALAAFGISCSGDEKPEEKLLVLAADVTSVEVGTEVSFTVMDGKSVITDASITGTNSAVVSNGKFKPSKAGDYSFTAKKKGFKDSNVVKITVTEVVIKLKLSLVTPESEIEAGSILKLLVLDDSDKPVEGAVLYNGVTKTDLVSDVQGNIVIPNMLWGEYKYLAVKGDIESNELFVNVPKLEGEGRVKFEDVDYNIDENIITLVGFYPLEKDGSTKYTFWNVISYDHVKEVLFAVLFYTPLIEKDGKYVPVLPNGTNEKVYQMVIKIKGEDGEYSVALGIFDGKTNPNPVDISLEWTNSKGDYLNSTFKASTPVFGTKPFSVEFKGYSYFNDKTVKKESRAQNGLLP